MYCEEDCGKRWRAYIQIALSCTCTTKRVSRFALPWALNTEPGHWELQVMATYTSAALAVCAFVSCTFTFLTATASLHTLNVRLIDGLQIWREKTKKIACRAAIQSRKCSRGTSGACLLTNSCLSTRVLAKQISFSLTYISFPSIPLLFSLGSKYWAKVPSVVCFLIHRKHGSITLISEFCRTGLTYSWAYAVDAPEKTTFENLNWHFA